MATFTVITDKEAPPPTRKGNGRFAGRMREYEKHIQSISVGKVGMLTIVGDETKRGITLRVARAAKRLKKSVQTWEVDGVVYFSVS